MKLSENSKLKARIKKHDIEIELKFQSINLNLLKLLIAMIS